MNDRADLIFVGGRVHTVNATNDVVSALAVGGGRILAAGGDAESRGLAGPRARVVELRGRSLLPGFIDGHCHLVGLGMAAASIDCKAPGMQSIAALQAAVKARAASQPPGTWIRGRGYEYRKYKATFHGATFHGTLAGASQQPASAHLALPRALPRRTGAPEARPAGTRLAPQGTDRT